MPQNLYTHSLISFLATAPITVESSSACLVLDGIRLKGLNVITADVLMWPFCVFPVIDYFVSQGTEESVFPDHFLPVVPVISLH